MQRVVARRSGARVEGSVAPRPNRAKGQVVQVTARISVTTRGSTRQATPFRHANLRPESPSSTSWLSQRAYPGPAAD
jgi:hypothetical protein